jgi:RND superfamily putative drug exporter
MISLAGRFLTGIDVFTGIAIGTILGRGLAERLADRLSALLSLPGQRGWTRARSRSCRRRTAARRSAFWNALVRRVVARRPVGGTAALRWSR